MIPKAEDAMLMEILLLLKAVSDLNASISSVRNLKHFTRSNFQETMNTQKLPGGGSHLTWCLNPESVLPGIST